MHYLVSKKLKRINVAGGNQIWLKNYDKYDELD